jgi:hypothetical protein
MPLPRSACRSLFFCFCETLATFTSVVASVNPSDVLPLSVHVSYSMQGIRFSPCPSAWSPVCEPVQAAMYPTTECVTQRTAKVTRQTHLLACRPSEATRELPNPQRVSQRCSGASTWCWELHQTITWRRALTLLGIKRCLWIREPVWENGAKLAGRRLLWSGKPASC